MTSMLITHSGNSAAKLKLIAGRTLEMGVPASKSVRIYSRGSGTLLKQLKSNADGTYKAYLPRDASYLIVAVDSNKVFNAVAQDNVGVK